MKQVEIGAAMTQGPRDTLQDVYHVIETGELSCFASVFDGHGPNGDVAASRAVEHMYNLGTDIPDNMTGTFASIDRSIRNIPWVRGATTATTVKVRPFTDGQGRLFKKVTTNNVGDSTALLVDPNDPFRVGGIVHLTADHDGSNQAEVERMAQAGYVYDGHYFRPLSCVSGIMISRSLGESDFPGVIPTPYWSQALSRAERLLLVTSDGVVRFGTQRDAIEMMCEDFRQGMPMGKIATRLVEEFATITRDNATAIVAHLPSTQSVNAR